jgi:2-dehydropantoate 2-reductase
MYQDVLANRETEIDIFSGEIIRLGELYGVKTPVNTELYNRVKNCF